MQQAKPYVYKGVHRETGEFYIGFRSANKLPAEQDLPGYRTSSKHVRPRFDEFDWQILMEFEKPECAYDFEQYMIHEAWGDPLLINKHCRWGSKIRFLAVKNSHSEEGKRRIGEASRARMLGNRLCIGRRLSAETIEKHRANSTGRKHTDEAKRKMGESSKGNKHNLGRIATPETRAKISQAGLGRTHTQETKEKIRQASIGREHSEETKEIIRQKRIGKKASQEAREKMSLSRLGNKYRLGKPHTAETKEKIRQASLNMSPESREKRRLASIGNRSMTGMTHTPEAKEKVRQANLGTRWYNNGETAVRVRDCPEGFVPGRLRKNTTKHNF